MNNEIKQRWVEALRSGRYKQTMGRLKDQIGYCCLGVLCEIAVKDGVIQRSGTEYGVGHDDDDGFHDVDLPLAVSNWAGLEDSEGVLPRTPSEAWDAPTRSLVGLNDGLGGENQHTFKQIADVIESKF